MRRVASRAGHLVDLSNVFDDTADTIFFDTAHVTDRGNALIADRLAPETEKLVICAEGLPFDTRSEQGWSLSAWPGGTW
jgi:hypothetical protein